MAGCPNPHYVKLPDGTEKKFDNEIEFKKYLAKGGLLELQKAKLIDVDLNFLKEFFVPGKQQPVSKTIKKSVGIKPTPRTSPLRQARKEGKYEGELNVTEKLSKKIEEGKKKLNDLRDSIKEKFAEYDKYKTEKSKKALEDARAKFKAKLEEQRQLNKDRTNERIQSLKDNVKERIANIKEKGQALADITKGLRDEIKAQLKDAKDIFKGAKIKGDVARRLVEKVNNAKTPMQLLSAIDYVSKSLQDIEYVNKLSKAKALSTQIKKLAKGLPSNLRVALTQLAKTNPKEIDDVNNYIGLMESAMGEIKQLNPSGINENGVKQLIETINKNNLSNRVDLVTDLLARRMSSDEINTLKDDRDAKLKLAKTPAEKSAIRDDYNNKVADVIDKNKKTLVKPVSASIEDMKSALTELTEQLNQGEPEITKEDRSQERRDGLEAINEVLRGEIDDFDTSSLDKNELEMFNAMKELDISKLSDKDLKFLNYALNNFIENQSFDGVAATILSKYKVQQSFTPSIIKSIKDGLISIESLANIFSKYATLPTKIASVTINDSVAAAIRLATGLGEHIKAYGSSNGYLQSTENTLNDIDNMSEALGIKKSYKSQIKIGVVLDMLQTKPGMTETEILDEFQKRKAALEKGIENAKAEMNDSKGYSKRNGEYVTMVEEVYNQFVKDTDNPSDLLGKLTANERKFRDALINKFLDIRPDLERIANTYHNKEFDGYNDYFTRSYVKPLVDTTIEDPSIASILSMSSFSGSPNMQTKVSTAFDDRTINNGNLPKGAIVNYSVLDVFQDNYRKQMYDIKTLGTRYHMAHVLTSPAFLESLGGNKDLLKHFQDAYINRIIFEKQGLMTQQTQSSFDFAMSIMNNIGNKIALGGGPVTYLKQVLPAFSSAMVVTGDRPTILFSTIRDRISNSEAFDKLIKQSPIYARHKRESQYLNSQIQAKDIKSISNKLRRNIKGWDDTMDSIFMSALKTGDQSIASLTYVMYYKYSLLEQGVIRNESQFDLVKEADSPNEQAQQYAEQMTSTTLNINEDVDRAKIRIGGSYMPFISFSANAKMNLAVNIGRAVNMKGVSSLSDRTAATRRIAAHAMEILTINLIGYYQRYLMIGIGSSAAAFAMGLGADEEEKEDINKRAEAIKQDVRKKNKENTSGYIAADLLTGQIGDNFTKPMLDAVIPPMLDAFYKATDIDLMSESQKKQQQSKTDPFLLLGTKGIVINKGLEAINNVGTFLQGGEHFKKQKYGYINSRDEIAIPHWADSLDRPAGSTAIFGAAALLNSMSLFGATSQEINTMSRTMVKVTKELETERIGKDKNLQEMFRVVPESKYGYTKIQDENATIKYGGSEYYLTPAQLDEWNKVRDEFVKKEYPSLYNEFKQSLPSIISEIKTLSSKFSNYKIKTMIRPFQYAEDQANKAIAAESKAIANLHIMTKYKNAGDETKLKLNKK
jgi:hypothetical protein